MNTLVQEKTDTKKGLGRGLSALFQEEPSGYAAEEQRVGKFLSLQAVRPGKFQPRRTFTQENLEELTESIRRNGVLQPILVRQLGDDDIYEIIAGERRWRAAQLAGLQQIPAIVKVLSDREALELAIVENVQRQDLSPLEEAEGYRRLIAEFGYTQEQLASTIGRSRSHITNMMRLLSLPDSVRELVESGQLSTSHARTLINNPQAEDLAGQFMRFNMSVRDAEALASATKFNQPPKEKQDAKSRQPDVGHLQQELQELLGLPVHIRTLQEGGHVSIRFANHQQLKQLMALMRSWKSDPQSLHPQ
jgi:ParB family transcriptional regulator, chromosome partitioning protein